jgi:formylglycine-generating enzyme required for sulfatase activity
MLGEIDMDTAAPEESANPSPAEQALLRAAEGADGQESGSSTLEDVEADRKSALPPAADSPPPGPSTAFHPPHEGRSTDVFSSPGFSFAAIPAGTFMMGSPEYERGRNPDEARHEVTLTMGFHLQAAPVTQRQWKLVMGTEPSLFREEGDDCPVEGVSWNEVREFMRKLNAMGGEYAYRLPTEAEWEYACRAGTDSAFAEGDITELFCGHDACLDATGWYCCNSGRKVHPVGRKAPNGWGLYDMHGNLCEWCQDWYGEYPAIPRLDPSGAAGGPGRVVRGGSWFSNARNCRSACRFHWAPHSRSDFIGFRLVRESR